VELEFGAVTERLEPENLKTLQFEQRKLLKNSGQLSVASSQSLDPLRPATAWECVFTKGIPPPEIRCGLDHFLTTLLTPGWTGEHKVKLL
jgi:hypothetical protein